MAILNLSTNGFLVFFVDFPGIMEVAEGLPKGRSAGQVGRRYLLLHRSFYINSGDRREMG